MDLELVEKLWLQTNISPQYRHALKQACIETGSAENSLTQIPILICQANGGKKEHMLPVITAWNILRYAARLLDDIEDGDAKSNSVEEAITLNVSTGFLFTVGQVLSSLESYGLDSPTASDIRQTFYKELLKICNGQHLDLIPDPPTLDECWTISGAKSGVFVGLICWAGGRVAHANEEQLELYRQFGYNLGLLDEIRDDLADLWSSEKHFSDLQAKNQHYSLPITYALSVLPDEKRQTLLNYLSQPYIDEESEELARELIIQSGAGMYLSVQSTYYYQQNLQMIADMDLPTEISDKLVNILDKARLPTIDV